MKKEKRKNIEKLIKRFRSPEESDRGLDRYPVQGDCLLFEQEITVRKHISW